MDEFQANPFGLLTFIVAPAILTNASSIMSLGTSNRFARAMDRARELTNQITGKAENDPETARRIIKLRYTERRGLLLVRALTAFYSSVGSFAAASLISLMGAVFFITHNDVLHQITQGIALAAGCAGVIGLVIGSCLLVFETRLVLRILHQETEYMLEQAAARAAAANEE